MKRFRALAWALVAAGLGAVAGLLYYVARPPQIADSRKLALSDETAMAMEGNTRVTSTQDGRIIWTMTASGVVFVTSPEEVRVEEPAAWVPLAEGGTVEVRGRRGLYFQSNEDIQIEHEVRVRLDRKGRLEWILDGDTGSYRRKEEAFYVSGLSGLIFPEDGDTVQVRGRQGRYDTRAKTMSVAGDVACVYSRGMTLVSDDLFYRIDTEEATTESAVTITGPDFRLTGRGLVADLKTRKVQVEREVKVRMEKGLGGPQ